MSKILLLLTLALALFAFEAEKAESSDYLNSKNFWIATYKNYKEFTKTENQIARLKIELAKKSDKEERRDLERKLLLLEAKLEAQKGFEGEFIDSMKLDLKTPEAIKINMLTYFTETYTRELKQIIEKHEEQKRKYSQALEYLQKIKEQAIADKNEKLESEVSGDIEYFLQAFEILKNQEIKLETYKNLIQKKLSEYEHSEIPKLLTTVAFILLIFLLMYIFKRFIMRYSEDEEREFALKKSVNLLGFLSIILFLLFMYIENILYALTIFGFIGAAVTIVMRDALLNVAGWFNITFGNFIKVGDRIMLLHETKPVIGDIIAISISRITLLETINHTTALETKRAGRVIFIPNNYIFNHYIYNYTHDSMKMIYDLVEIDFLLDSNFEKIEQITVETVESITSRYLDLAKRQFENLQKRYEIRNTNLKPQVQFIMNNDKNCIRMYLWFISPYREILNIRSTTTLELNRRYRDESDIKLLNQEAK